MKKSELRQIIREELENSTKIDNLILFLEDFLERAKELKKTGPTEYMDYESFIDDLADSVRELM